MDPRERMNDPLEALRVLLDGRQASIWTALPGVIEDFDPTEMTASIKPAIQARVQDVNGVFGWDALPLLIHCPVQFPAAGGFTLTFPVVAGDECLVVFASRCIDAWWQSGGIQTQAELRMHDLSDGFAILGFRSIPRVISAISSNSVQLRSDDGTTSLEVKSDQTVNIVAPGNCNVVGNLHVTGAVIAGFGTGDQIGLQTHKHTQANDSAGDSEQPTNAPTAGT